MDWLINKNKQKSVTFSTLFFWIVQIDLIMFKIFHLTDISWYQVFSPIVIYLVIIFVALLIVAVNIDW